MRQLIREYVRSVISEMPLAKVYPQTRVRSDSTPLAPGDESKLAKYVQSPMWKKTATRLYNNLEIPIHVVPGYVFNDESLAQSRVWKSSTNTSDSIKFLNYHTPELGEETVRELTDAIKRGEAVIVTATSRLKRNNWPSPWMIVHAMYDDAYIEEHPGTKNAMQLHRLIWLREGDDTYDTPIFGWDRWYSALTMKSARDRNINTPADLVAEICTQEVLDRRGFHYNPTGDPEFDAFLERVKSIVSGERQRFQQRIAGRVTLVWVF